MKKILFSTFIISLLAVNFSALAQDKSKRASPPAKATATTASGLVITIDYSQPAVKGRTIGKDLEPMAGVVWRAGANEATVFEISKDAKVDGKELKAGKYSLYMISGDAEWTIIFNKTWNQWGTIYKESEDALRIKVKPGKAASFAERLTYTVDASGKVSMMWGNGMVSFMVK